MQGKNFLTIPKFGMGTWCFGGRDTHNPDNDDAAQIAALQAGLQAGITLIDTAEYYAAGYAETLIGRAIAGFERSKLFLTSKVWKNHLHRDDVFRAAENSLRRLGIDQLDLYLYHQPDDAVPLEETIGAMNELFSQGMVKAIGVSNFSPERMARAIRCSNSPIAVNQCQYNLAVREVETTGLLELCRRERVVMQAWRPLRDLQPSPLTEKLCARYGVTFAQLALNWLLRQEGVAVITAMKSVSHIHEGIAAADFTLTECEAEMLATEYPFRAPSAVPLR